jgi:4a-hydroxytetrahydrobiopterin dehydratase
MAAIEALSANDISARLVSLPRWTSQDGVLQRTFRTGGWKASLMLVNAIGHLAEAAWHHPDMHLSWDRVIVRLSTHDVSGISERDFALARRIEEFVNWRPSPDGPLEGTPDDDRFAYIVDKD